MPVPPVADRLPPHDPPPSPLSWPPACEDAVAATVEFTHHGPLPVRVSTEAHGPAEAPAVVALGGISADHHLLPTRRDRRPGWWAGMVGPDRPLDTTRHRVIGVGYAGGPMSVAPPAPITTEDQARVVLAALDHHGIGSATWIGASYGGMVALAAAQLEPSRVRSLVVACAAHRPHPMATALRALQRAIAREGSVTGTNRRSLQLARAIAMTTYRSAEEFDERFTHRPDWVEGRPTFEVERYLTARGSDFADRFTASDFVRLSQSIDLHDVQPGAIRQPMDVVSVTTDAVVPPFLAEELVHGASGPVRHTVLHSRYGHDAFLKEVEAFGAVARRHLCEEAAR